MIASTPFSVTSVTRFDEGKKDTCGIQLGLQSHQFLIQKKINPIAIHATFDNEIVQ